MNFPETPNTIIEGLIEDEKSAIWQGMWRKFFDIYYSPVKLMVKKSFIVNGWNNVPAHIIDELVSDVFYNLIRIFSEKRYDKKKTKFRYFLKAISNRRVIDFIRVNSKKMVFPSLDDEKNDNLERLLEDLSQISFLTKLEDDEILSFKQSFLLDLYMSIRDNFEARTTAAFEMIKSEGKNSDEVAKVFGVSKNVINNDIYRVIKKLKEIVLKNENKREFM